MEYTLKFERSEVFEDIRILSPEALPYSFCEKNFGPTHQLEERVYAIYLDASKNVITEQLISIGGITATIVCIPKVLRTAILTGATGIILIHNHPSGARKASRADISLCNNLRDSSRTMGIELCDFMIWTGQDIVSFRQEGLL